MTKEEKNSFGFWKKFYLITIIAICFCSCTDHEHCNRHFDTGVVEQVEKSYSYAKFKVLVKEKGKGINKTDYYYFYTNDVLQVGDTIHIGKK